LQENEFLNYKALYMRPIKDYRKDSIVKVELLKQIRNDWGTPLLWFDDREQVVETIRKEGIRVLQVSEGKF
jgi:NMD protein affecting ribosome stability and mRNA decay